MIAYVYTIGDYGMNARNFEIKKIYLYFTVNGQLESNRLKMVHIKASHISTIRGLYFLRNKFPCLELFRHLQAVVLVSNFCSLSTFLVFSISVMYLTIF